MLTVYAVRGLVLTWAISCMMGCGGVTPEPRAPRPARSPVDAGAMDPQHRDGGDADGGRAPDDGATPQDAATRASSGPSAATASAGAAVPSLGGAATADEALLQMLPDPAPPQAAFLVRGRVAQAWRERGRDSSGAARLFDVRVIEILEFIRGEAADVLPTYRRRFPLYAARERRQIRRPRGNPPPVSLERLERGQEYLFHVDLPGELGTSDTHDAPRRVRRRFGRYFVELHRVSDP